MTAKVFKSWDETGIDLDSRKTGEQKTLCPQCSHTRKHKHDKCLSVNVGMGTFNCHNCDFSGGIKADDPNFTKKVYTQPELKTLPLSERVRSFFSGRGIEDRTLEYFKITESSEWMYEKGAAKAGNTTAINFPYYENGQLVNVKFRASEKRFKMVSGAKLVFFNLAAIEKSEEVVICEGEIDCMSLYQCNVFNAVSVPNGASRGSQKLEYLDNCIEYFESKKKVVIATDGDEAGQMLAEELVRRLGKERCYLVRYPEGCKDANEVLLKHGRDAVRALISQAEPFPLEGIFTAEDIAENVLNIYRNGFPKGDKVGYTFTSHVNEESCFDDLLSFRKGELTTITGIPNSGKSQFIDQIMVRLAARCGWRFGVFSPEQQPTELHVSGLIEKYIGEGMFGKSQMNAAKLNAGIDFVNDQFFFMKQAEIDTTIDGIIDKAKELVARKGINGLLIDPYNYIEHKIPPGYSETQYISELLTKLKNFCHDYKVHCFLIAHPTKIQKDKKTGKYEVPTLYNVAGSAHFYNKTDNGLTVYRDFETNVVTVYVQKVRFRFIGRIGFAEFQYDRPTGRYAHLNYQFESELREPQQAALPLPTPKEVPSLTDIHRMNLEPAPF
jgi:twinkle protein